MGSSRNKQKKLLIDYLSKKLLELEFKQHNAIKSKCLKWTVKNILPKYKQWKKYNQKYNRQKLENNLKQRIV